MGNWYAPSLLWEMNDRGVELKAPQHAVCEVLPFMEESAESAEDIYQSGVCPEGTACGCPDETISKQLSLEERRDRRFSTFFVTPGSAIVPSILNCVKNDAVVKFMVEAVISVATGQAHHALHHAHHLLELPLELLEFVHETEWHLEMAWEAFKEHREHKEEEKCAETAACWAVPPTKTKRREGGPRSCRVSEKAEEGGSPVWFLPPQLMKVEKRFQMCSLKPCSKDEIASQKVGFGGKENQNIYNCQPLIWEDMEEIQQTKLMEVLRSTGVHEEYSF